MEEQERGSERKGESDRGRDGERGRWRNIENEIRRWIDGKMDEKINKEMNK